jgi:hypothetical protein
MTQPYEEERHKEERHKDEDDPVSEEGQGPWDDATYPASNPDGLPRVRSGTGGYDDRDPKTDMPRVPSVPETQDE